MTPVYCECCEAPAERTDLGYIANDGTMGTVAGIACSSCLHIKPIKGAPYVPNGKRVIIPEGLTAFEHFMAKRADLERRERK